MTPETEVLDQLKQICGASLELLSHENVNLVALHALANEEARHMDVLRAIWYK